MLLDAALNLWGKNSELHANGDFFLVEDGEKREPTTEEWDALNKEAARLKAANKKMEYARNRRQEYMKLNQFELMYDDKINGTNTWVEAIQAIKAKFPKDE